MTRPDNAEHFEQKYAVSRGRAARRIEEAALGQAVGVNGYTTVAEARISLEHARAISRNLFAWYNDAHHHSGLSYLTPAAVHYGRAATVLTTRHRTRLAAYAAHPERFVNGPPRPETLPTAVWINRPPKPTREDASGATPLTPDDPQHGVIRRSPPTADRPITLVTSLGSLQ